MKSPNTLKKRINELVNMFHNLQIIVIKEVTKYNKKSKTVQNSMQLKWLLKL